MHLRNVLFCIPKLNMDHSAPYYEIIRYQIIQILTKDLNLEKDDWTVYVKNYAKLKRVMIFKSPLLEKLAITNMRNIYKTL
jgi:hypothetical protein